MACLFLVQRGRGGPMETTDEELRWRVNALVALIE